MPDTPATAREYSCVLLKPDATKDDTALHVLYHLLHSVDNGHIRASRVLNLTPEQVREHYAHIVNKPFFPQIEQYMRGGPVWANVIEGGPGTIQQIRDSLGATDPRKAAPGTVRAKYGRVGEGEDVRNVAHASDSIEAARIEIRRFFTRDEIESAMPELAHEIFGDSRFDVKA